MFTTNVYYVCPQRAMPADAVTVRGLTAEFLADKPLFAAIADEFLIARPTATRYSRPSNLRPRAARAYEVGIARKDLTTRG
jgi:hypothetical protein